VGEANQRLPRPGIRSYLRGNSSIASLEHELSIQRTIPRPKRTKTL
jgi:hypothetical protein